MLAFYFSMQALALSFLGLILFFISLSFSLALFMFVYSSPPPPHPLFFIALFSYLQTLTAWDVHQRQKAALKIQALWRGYVVRKRTQFRLKRQLRCVYLTVYCACKLPFLKRVTFSFLDHDTLLFDVFLTPCDAEMQESRTRKRSSSSSQKQLRK